MPELRLEAKIGLDGAGFLRTSRIVEGAVGGIKNRLAGAFTVGAITAYLKGVNSAIARIKDLSEQTGLSTDEVQELQFATAQSGQTFEDVATALSRMGSARKNAAEGNRELRETFDRYGVTLDNLNDPSLRNIDLLKKMGEAMKGLSLTAGQRQELRDLLGRSGDRLEAVLKDLGDKRAPIIPKEDIEAVDALNKALELTKLRLQAIVGRNLGELIRSPGEKIASLAKDYFSSLIKDPAKILLPGLSIFDALNKKNFVSASKPGEAGFIGPVQLREVGDPLFKDLSKKEKEREKAEDKLVEGAVDTGTRHQADSLAKIGGFVGAATVTDQVLFVQKNQLVTQQEILRLVDKIAHRGNGNGIERAFSR